MVAKTEFFWAIVGDSAPEPVAVTGPDGERMAYTIGCEDSFPLDTPDSPVEIIHRPQQWAMHKDYDDPPKAMDIPQTPTARKKEREKNERRLARDAARGIYHGYVGFGARVAQQREP